MRYGMVIDLRTCAGCAACVMACKQANATPQGVYWCNLDIWEEGTYPDARKRVLPHACMECSNAACVRICPTGASHYSDDHLVLIDQDVCIGCQLCVQACPYGARWFNGEEAAVPYFGDGFEPTPYEQARTLQEHQLGKTGKCTFCVDRIRAGKEPMCVKTCITRTRYFGDLDDPESEVATLIRDQGAVQLKPEAGTDPSVYYIGL